MKPFFSYGWRKLGNFIVGKGFDIVMIDAVCRRHVPNIFVVG